MAGASQRTLIKFASRLSLRFSQLPLLKSILEEFRALTKTNEGLFDRA